MKLSGLDEWLDECQARILFDDGGVMYGVIIPLTAWKYPYLVASDIACGRSHLFTMHCISPEGLHALLQIV